MSFRKSISQTIVFGQLLGLMPISGGTFKWKSFKFLQCVVVSIGSLLFLVSMFANIVVDKKYSLANFVTLIVYLADCITIILFFKLGMHWSKLIQSWDDMERSLPTPQSSSYLCHQLNLRLLVILSSSISKLIWKQTSANYVIENIFSRIYFTNFSNNLSCDGVSRRRLHKNSLHEHVSIALQSVSL